jgi:ATP-dependent Clp protease ATP-binding subunit ClpC
MGTLNPNIPSPELTKALNATAARMRTLKLPRITPALLLLTFARDGGSAANRMLQALAAERSFRLDELAISAEHLAKNSPGLDADFAFVDDAGQRVPLSTEMLVALDEGRAIAQASDETQVGAEHALGGLAERGISSASLLRRYGISPETMASRLTGIAQNKRVGSQDVVAQAKAGEVAPVYVRADLMQDLKGLLALADHRHVILVGDAGVGRKSLVAGLGLQIAEKQGPPGVISLVQAPETALLADAEKAVDTAWKQAKDGILFLPNIERFFSGAAANAEFPKATRAVQRALLAQSPVVIATTTDAAWNDRLASDSVVREHTHRLRVPEPTVEETLKILEVHRPRLEHDYGVKIEDSALPAAANLGKRYVAGVALPTSALAALHRAGALLKLAAQGTLQPLPGKTLPVSTDSVLDADDVAAAISVMTGIPVSKLGLDERQRYARMVEALHQRIIGQEEAVMAVSRAVKIARVGLKDPKRPIGSFLFLGPTGVGKTELAKALAEFMFGSEDAMVVLDMSEFQQDHTVNRLIGAPPGYVGYEGGGQLTEKVRQRPHTVVLFDEVEKAHPRVLDVLLQILEEGRLTDAQGRTVSFADTVVIMTSNMGSQYLDEPVVTDEKRDQVLETMRQTLRPEFLNRIDEIVLFSQLMPDQLKLILDLMLKKEIRLLEDQGFLLEITPAAREWMLAQNDHPEWGARPLRRIIQKNLREPLADWMLTANPEKGSRVVVDGGEQGLSFTM